MNWEIWPATRSKEYLPARGLIARYPGSEPDQCDSSKPPQQPRIPLTQRRPGPVSLTRLALASLSRRCWCRGLLVLHFSDELPGRGSGGASPQKRQGQRADHEKSIHGATIHSGMNAGAGLLRSVHGRCARPRAGPVKRQTQADERNRTADPFITSEVLYQLSYVGAGAIVRRVVGPVRTAAFSN